MDDIWLFKNNQVWINVFLKINKCEYTFFQNTRLDMYKAILYISNRFSSLFHRTARHMERWELVVDVNKRLKQFKKM